MEIIDYLNSKFLDFHQINTSCHEQGIQEIVSECIILFKNKIDACMLYADANILIDYSWEKLNIGHWKNVNISCRELYALGNLFKVISLALLVKTSGLEFFNNEKKLLLNVKNMEDYYKYQLKLCDMGILLGAPIFDELLANLAQFLSNLLYTNQKNNPCSEINYFKCKHSDFSNIDKSKYLVPSKIAPSVENFIKEIFNISPIKMLNAIDHWPALNQRKWTLNYFQKIAGFRTVPIELGARYTDANWSQKLMLFNDFIAYIQNSDNSKPIAYLAQHNLFEQISILKNDFCIPEYTQTGKNDFVDVNAWFGPKGTISPLHYDLKHNIFCQIIGQKYIKLFSPEVSDLLYPYENMFLNNTSQIDIDNPDFVKFPQFKHANYMECILNEGEILYIPPKWWHYVRSLSISFSLSFWWE